MIVDVIETGHIQVKTLSGLRYVISPGDDLSGEPEEVRDAAAGAWTPQVINDFLQREAERMVAMTMDDAALVEQFRSAIQSHVDSTAVSRRYDNGVSLASYVTSGNPEWATEAQAFVAWRDTVWAYAYAELDKVLAGEREQPDIETFIGELPVIEWPEGDAL